MTNRLGSLDLVAAEARNELATQLRHLEGLDAKAGIVLGFAGVLVVLGSRSKGVLAGAGLSLAVVTALFALSAFLPRAYPALKLRGLRDRYAGADEVFAKVEIMDTYIAMSERASVLLEVKNARLVWGMRVLAASVVLLALATLLD